MNDVLLAARPEAPAVHAESRAFQLAAARRGRVHLVAAGDAEAAPTLPDEAQLRRDLAARRGEGCVGSVTLAAGEPWRLVLDVAQRQGVCALVLGAGGGADLNSLLFGAPAERLAHRAAEPVLVVRRPAEEPYGHIVVATDFSEGSRHALLVAHDLFPHPRITLLHAYRAPFQGLMPSEANRDEVLARAEREQAEFLDPARWPEPLRERVTPVLVEGDVKEAILRHAERDPFQLAVFGAHGRTGPLEKLLGGTAEQLLHALPMDVMLVRQPGSKAA